MQSSVHREKASSIAMILETQRNVEFPHRNVDKRPRKRPRLAWDAAPLLPPPPPTVTNCPTYIKELFSCVSDHGRYRELCQLLIKFRFFVCALELSR